MFRHFFVLFLLKFAFCCLNNYNYRFSNEWKENGLWKSNGNIKPNFYGKLKNWEIRIEFTAPLAADITTWVTTKTANTKGKTKVVMKAKHYNKILDASWFELSYFAYFKNKQGSNHLKCVEFCGTVVGTNKKLCDSLAITTQASVITTTTTTSTTKTATKQPTVPTTAETIATTTATTTTTTTKKPTDPLTKKPDACTPKYDYSEVLEKSLLFYEAQRSGKLPADQRVKWRKDSTMTDGSEAGKDLTGGYFDAGDFVKFGFPMAATITNLAWGMLEFPEGYRSSGQYEYGLKAIKWGTDYFLKCHISKTTFSGQVGDGDLDHAYWGRPEDMTLVRPVYSIDENRPGSELAAETAAALAASYLLFRDKGDLMYALDLLTHAKQMYSFATLYRGMYHESIPDAANYYKSHSGYNDELAWAALWLFRATGEQLYKDAFLTEFGDTALNESPSEYSWDNKWMGVKVLAAQLKVTDKDYLANLKSLLEQPKKTPKGLFYVQKWGANRHAANLAFLARMASRISDRDFYNNFARSQIHYMLGDAGRSYVVGFGNNPPQRPHHKSSSCPSTGQCGWSNFNSPNPNPHVLYGALVGGPDHNDRYTDSRQDYVKNEVACDYNAGFQSAVAGLIDLALEGDCGNKYHGL